MEYDLLRLCEDIKKKRSGFQVAHGPILRAGNTPEDIGKPGVDPFRRDPLLVLREHIVTHDLRLQEVLEKYDEDHSYSLNPEDFTTALEVWSNNYSYGYLGQSARMRERERQSEKENIEVQCEKIFNNVVRALF